MLNLTWDERTRSEMLRSGGLDLASAAEVFAGVRFEHPDCETADARGGVASVGFLGGQMVVVEWEVRGEGRHVLAMRKANDREQKLFGERLGSLGRP